MDGWFRIEVDSRAHFVRLTMGGFYDPPAITRLREALKKAIGTLHCDANQHAMLCDIKSMSIQSQDIVTCFAGLVGQPDIRSRRLAFVTGASLARHQAHRLTDREGVAFFHDQEEALEWLQAA